MKLASELGKARKSGDEERIKQAKEAHDSYKELCLQSDEMQLHTTHGNLYGGGR